MSPRTPKWGAQRGGSTAIGGTLNSLERGKGESLDLLHPKAENKGRRDPKISIPKWGDEEGGLFGFLGLPAAWGGWALSRWGTPNTSVTPSS